MNKRYFPHDYDAFADPKIQKLMVKFGATGYGAFWHIVEQLYQNDGVLPLTNVDAIAFALHLDCTCIASIIQDFNLFENDGQNFWSKSVNARIERIKKVSESRRTSAASRWNSVNLSNSNANAMQKPGNININIKENNIREGKKESVEPIDYNEIVNLWTRHCPELSKPTKMTDKRREKIRIRLAEMGKTRADQIITLETVFIKIGESDFCNGKNERGGKADFECVFVNESNWVKVIENKYINKTPGRASASTTASQNVNGIWGK